MYLEKCKQSKSDYITNDSSKNDTKSKYIPNISAENTNNYISLSMSFNIFPMNKPRPSKELREIYYDFLRTNVHYRYK